MYLAMVQIPAWACKILALLSPHLVSLCHCLLPHCALHALTLSLLHPCSACHCPHPWPCSAVVLCPLLAPSLCPPQFAHTHTLSPPVCLCSACALTLPTACPCPHPPLAFDCHLVLPLCFACFLHPHSACPCPHPQPWLPPSSATMCCPLPTPSLCPPCYGR